MIWETPNLDARGPLLEPDTGDAAPPAAPTPATPTPTAEDLIPKREAQKAFRDRDKAKAGVKLFASMLGIDADDVRVEETDDKDNPYKLAAPGLDELRASIDAARNAKPRRWEDRERELGDKHQRQVERMTQTHTAATSARDGWIRQQAAIAPIRMACAAEKAFDPAADDAAKSGQFDDIVALLAPRVRVETAADDDGTLTVKVVALNEDGTAMLDEAGKPATVRRLVADFLAKRPHYRQNRFQPGPGAGGLSLGQAAGVATNGRPSARDQVGRAFGVGV